jgi:hypothetical protein
MNGVWSIPDADVLAMIVASKHVRKFDSRVWVVHMKLEHMSRGIRPTCVPPHAFRIRVGLDTTIADLVCALERQSRFNSICFDFAGNAPALWSWICTLQ